MTKISQVQMIQSNIKIMRGAKIEKFGENSCSYNMLQDTGSEGNLWNITQTNPIDISAKPGTIEHVHVGQNCSADESEAYKALFKEFRDIFSWSYQEIPGIDLSILVHEIKTYPMAKPIRKKLRQVHPWKAATIKAEIEKLLKAGFIYPVPLMKWVSNVVPVNKK